MATKIVFGNKTISEPGTYSRFKSGINNPPSSLSFGNVILIDTGLGSGYGGGAIAGTLTNGKAAIQSFSTLTDFKNTIRGGAFNRAAKWLFYPDKNRTVKGVDNLYFISAKAATPAELTFTFGDHSTSTSIIDGGEIVLQVLNEGTVGNGVLSGSDLIQGYAGKMRAGVLDNTKYIFDFYVGTYTGTDSDGDPYGDLELTNCLIPQLIVSSKEVSTISELVTWMNTNATFKQYFKLKTSTVDADSIDATDLSFYSSSYNLAIGGTETYGSTYVTSIIESIGDLDFTFILSDKYATNGKHAYNASLVEYLASARYGQFLIIGGGNDANALTGTNSSTDIAENFNTTKVVVVHAGLKKTKIDGSGYKEYDSFIKAAAVTGRIAGLEPQVPGTFKTIDMDADMHDMKEKERLLALDKGVLFTKYDSEFGAFIIEQSINTLQNNDYLIDAVGDSYEVSIERIKAQLNREIIINAKRQLLSQPSGVTRGSLSAATVKTWTEGFLTTKEVNSSQGLDNLILSFGNVIVSVVGDTYKIDYDFVPNYPVNKLLFTGTITDSAIV